MCPFSLVKFLSMKGWGWFLFSPSFAVSPLVTQGALWPSMEMQSPVVDSDSAHDLGLFGPSEAELLVYRCDLLRGQGRALRFLPQWSEIRVLVPFTPWPNGRTGLLSTLLCIRECFLINPWYPLDWALVGLRTGPSSFLLLLIKTHGLNSFKWLLFILRFEMDPC